jgi:hypothetical protein
VTLKKSGSRSITVDGETYRWTFGDNLDVWNVTIQRAVGSGQKLVLNWAAHATNPGPPASITPSMIARAIQLAIAAGWTPSVSRPDLRGKLQDDTLKTWTV